MLKKNKKAFTLLEIMIVIVIIGILMGATMKFGGDRIGFLNNKNMKEQFVTTYEKLYSDNMMTSYHLGNIYQKLDIIFDVGAGNFTYLYDGYSVDYSGSTHVDGGVYRIEDLYVNKTRVNKLDLTLQPYKLGCKINGEDMQLARINILVNNFKNYCFEVQSDDCRIQKITCD